MSLGRLLESILFVALLPALWLFGLFVARRVVRGERFVLLVSPGLAFAPWFLAVHLAGKLTGSFVAGLWTGTALVASAGIALHRDTWRSALREAATTLRRTPAVVWCGAVLSALLVAPSIYGYLFHDEVLAFGHMSIVAQIQNGPYPPVNPVFPSGEYHYHYGFQTFSAILGRLAHLPSDRAIDVAGTLLWLYEWCLLVGIGERFVAPRTGTLTAALVTFGGGMPLLCPEGLPRIERWLGQCQVEKLSTNPPVASYFHQHPWALGFCFFFLALLLWSERSTRPGVWRYATLSVVLGVLSISEFVAFVCLVPSLAVAECFDGRKIEKRRIAPMVAAAVAIAILAKLCGGFLSSTSEGGGGKPYFHALVTSTLTGSLQWHWLSFGLLLPLGASGLVFLRRGRILLLLLLVGSLGVLNLFRITGTWDIVKFGVVTAVASSIGAAAACVRLARARPRLLTLPIAALAVLLCTHGGALFHYTLIAYRDAIGEGNYPRRKIPLSADDEAALAWLHAHAHPRDLVYRSLNQSIAYAQRRGIFSPWAKPESHLFMHGHSAEHIQRRNRLLTSPPVDVQPFRNEGIRWLVLDPSEPALQLRANAWEAEGQARTVERFGPLRIVQILP
ncbi:hypothetical protein [Polyangium aurulentum]|uniref:hypothetical protein n=1 Tax=Polyangium aurulentum TaxID=2567896 RepID=UPI0010AE04B2|nr:hypothetical protein [Polyangium aurulentum]UQA56148.1 hypothetical protein E8A73_033235 [Polyangium aurulentum]